MAVRVSIATGNFTTAGTWGLVDATSYLNAENATESLLTTAYSGTRSSAFTPGAITISHIGVKLCERIGTTGTISVCLELDSDNSLVAGTEVTINVSDLPSALETDLNGGWIFFKLATPVTLLAATAYQVAAKTSNATQVDLWCDGTADNLSRALVTTTTGAPAAGDDLIIAGEKTGAGTGNAFTVTMDNTATTDFGSAPTAANSLIAPGVAICDDGTLTFGTTAATNYYLKVSNSVVIYSGGTLNIGTTGTPIPRDSTAVLEFDPAADGNYGLLCRNLGTLVIQGLSRTSGKNVVSCKLNTDEAAAQTTLGVDTDTGWLNGDSIVIAETGRGTSIGELRTLNANANASDMTVSSGLTRAHSGTSPTQAEVGLLTRNVRIRSATSTLMAYVYCAPTSQVDIDWAEFYYLGENATNKAGIEFGTTTGSFNMQYCSVHDTEDGGIWAAATNGNNIVISNNVFYNLNTGNVTAAAIQLQGTLTFSNNICIGLNGLSASAASAIRLTTSGSNVVFTGNAVSGCGASGNNDDPAVRIECAVPSGNFDNNNIHSNIRGLYISGVTLASDKIYITNTKLWRNNGAGLFNNGSASRTFMGWVVLDTCNIFGNSTDNILISGGNDKATILEMNNVTVNGDTTYSTTNGINLGSNSEAELDLIMRSCDFSTVSGIKTAHTNDINITSSLTRIRVNSNYSKLGATNEFLNFPNSVSQDSYIRLQSHDQTAGNHSTRYKYGTVARETTTVHTGSQAAKMTPLSATKKLQSPSFFVAVASGASLTPSVYVREDGSYNGARARLILKRNDALGITADTVIDTATAASDGAWEELTGTTAAASADGVMEFVIDCDGTAGNLFVDSFTVT